MTPLGFTLAQSVSLMLYFRDWLRSPRKRGYLLSQCTLRPSVRSGDRSAKSSSW